MSSFKDLIRGKYVLPVLALFIVAIAGIIFAINNGSHNAVTVPAQKVLAAGSNSNDNPTAASVDTAVIGTNTSVTSTNKSASKSKASTATSSKATQLATTTTGQAPSSSPSITPQRPSQNVTWGTTTANVSIVSGGQCLYTFTNTAHIAMPITENVDTLWFSVSVQALDGPDTIGENPIFLLPSPSRWDKGQNAGNATMTTGINSNYGAMVLYPDASYKVIFLADTQISPSPLYWYSSAKTFKVPSSCGAF